MKSTDKLIGSKETFTRERIVRKKRDFRGCVRDGEKEKEIVRKSLERKERNMKKEVKTVEREDRIL